MVLATEKQVGNRHLYFNGITQVTVADGESGVLSAFVRFAVHHTHTDAMVYENAASQCANRLQKIFFVQLGSRKREIINKLKSQVSDSSFSQYVQKLQKGFSASNYLGQIVLGPDLALEEAIRFVEERERTTLAHYQKLEKIMLHKSTKALFDYLIGSQHAVLAFLDSYYQSVQPLPEMELMQA